MPRVSSSAMLTWMSNPELPIALFFYGVFNDGPVRLWTGYGDVTWSGETWKGIGGLGSITQIEEGSNVMARGITVNLDGFTSSLLTEVMGQFKLGGDVTVYVAGLNDGAIIDSPIAAFVGRMDQPTVKADVNAASISINCESRLVEMDVAVDRRYTADDLQMEYPGDRGFQFVTANQEKALYWGQVPTTQGNI